MAMVCKMRLILYTLLVLLCFSCSPVSKGVVFTVDGEPVSLSQFEQQMEKEKLMVIRDFEIKYKATFGPGFWTMNFGGDIPVNALRRRAKDAIVVSVVKKMIAREMGLIEHIGYEDFLKELDSVNKVRIKAVKEGNVIYGPVTYTLEMYSDYYMSTLENAIRAKISTPGNTPDEILLKYNKLIQERVKKAEVDTYQIDEEDAAVL